MIGDQNDIVQRFRLTLPARWFSDVAPVLDGLLTGMSAPWTGLYSLLQIARLQSRVQSVFGAFLDLAAGDYFGRAVGRRLDEADDNFRQRLLTSMQRKRGTRQALIDAGASCGFIISPFEAAQPADTGCYNVSAGLAWSANGAWGSLQMPLETLLVARRGVESFSDELLPALAAAMPAGGAAWVHISA